MKKRAVLGWGGLTVLALGGCVADGQPNELANVSSVPTTALQSSAPPNSIPDFLCTDLEAVQESARAQDIRIVETIDKSGDSRKQLWDRNWLVVGQTNTGEGVTLEVLKKDEASDCNLQSRTTTPELVTTQSAIPAINTTVAIQPDVVIRVIREDSFLSRKRGYDVVLSRRVSEAELAEIANTLVAAHIDSYDRIFTSYWLEHMDPMVDGSWASAHFTPELEVQIFGVTPDERDLLVRTIDHEDPREVLGRWWDEGEILGGLVTIYRDDAGDITLERMFEDGGGPSIRQLGQDPDSERVFSDADWDDVWYGIDDNMDLLLLEGPRIESGFWDRYYRLNP